MKKKRITINYDKNISEERALNIVKHIISEGKFLDEETGEYCYSNVPSLVPYYDNYNVILKKRTKYPCWIIMKK